MSQRAAEAESVVTSKISEDFARAGREPELGAAQARFGRVTATRLAARPGHAAYNKARGFSRADSGRLAEIRAFFAAAGVPPLIEVWAGDASAVLGQHLARAGFYAAEVNATLAAAAGGPAAAAGPGGGADVREVTADDDTAYLDTLFEGYGLGADEDRLSRMMMTAEHRSPRLRRYLAYQDGRPAAAGGLYAAGGQCYLAGAATIPALRGRGSQSALIRRRLRDAAAAAGQVIVTTAFGSPSQANLERLGFAIVHTRMLWRRLEEPEP
jgi:ribosomal protein S18 acetylase RimI-like enzyme